MKEMFWLLLMLTFKHNDAMAIYSHHRKPLFVCYQQDFHY